VARVGGGWRRLARGLRCMGNLRRTGGWVCGGMRNARAVAIRPRSNVNACCTAAGFLACAISTPARAPSQPPRLTFPPFTPSSCTPAATNPLTPPPSPRSRSHYDSLAEWSKALAPGASLQGRGLEPHSCHRLGACVQTPRAMSMQYVGISTSGAIPICPYDITPRATCTSTRLDGGASRGSPNNLCDVYVCTATTCASDALALPINTPHER
jgi:hypothetical protein